MIRLALDPTHAWVVTDNGSVIGWDGSSWHLVDQQTGLNSVWACSPNAVFTAGSMGAFDVWNGVSWARPNALAGATVLNLSTSSRDDLWVVGQSPVRGGVAVHFDGQHFSRFDPSGTVSVRSVWADGAGDAWAVAEASDGSRSLLRWQGAGFSPVTLPATVTRPSAVGGLSATDVWLASEGGRVDRWEGNAWTNAYTSTSTQNADPALVHVTSDTRVVVGGFIGRYYTSGVSFALDGGSWAELGPTADLWTNAAGDLCLLAAQGPYSMQLSCSSSSVPPLSFSVPYPTRIWGTSVADLWVSPGVAPDWSTLHLDAGAWEAVVLGDPLPAASWLLGTGDVAGHTSLVSEAGGATYQQGP